jgi:hypothetical protein
LLLQAEVVVEMLPMVVVVVVEVQVVIVALFLVN